MLICAVTWKSHEHKLPALLSHSSPCCDSQCLQNGSWHHLLPTGTSVLPWSFWVDQGSPFHGQAPACLPTCLLLHPSLSFQLPLPYLAFKVLHWLLFLAQNAVPTWGHTLSSLRICWGRAVLSLIWEEACNSQHSLWPSSTLPQPQTIRMRCWGWRRDWAGLGSQCIWFGCRRLLRVWGTETGLGNRLGVQSGDVWFPSSHR